MDELASAWSRALRPPGGPATARPAVDGAAERARDDLVRRWREPHRHYHTLDHLAAVLRVVERHAEVADDPAAVALAAWFHDAVYDPHRVDNEEASALLAEATLPVLDVPPARVAEVARLVRLTASHDPAPDDRNGCLITDADLAVLAGPPRDYRRYADGVRREYAHVSDAAFAAGRAGVLRTLLELPRLFHTPALRTAWEATARANLAAELATLDAPPG
jgi:predicted metal-dependent HD superfamily phosphohydrolase